MADSDLEKQPLLLEGPFSSLHEKNWGLYKPPLLWPVKLILGCIFLLPRLLIALVTLVLVYIMCLIATCGAKIPFTPEDPPLSKWRSNLVRWTCRPAARIVLFCLGFFWIEERTFPKSPPEAYDRARANMVVCNHIGYIEIVYLVGKRAPSFVAKKAVASAPIIGTITSALQAIFVQRESADSRAVTSQLMDMRSSDEGRRRGFPPVMVFPEGTTTNNTEVLTFQAGAFRAGRPVHVYSIKTPFTHFSPAWGQESPIWHCVFLLLQPYNRLVVTDCGVVEPTAAEKDDYKSYARRVQEIMADASGLKVSSKTCYDGPALAHMKRAKKKRSMSIGERKVASEEPTRLARKVSIVEHMAGVETPKDMENAEEGETLEAGTTPQEVMRGYWKRRSSRLGQIAPE